MNTEKEAHDLLVLACETNLHGEFIAKELVMEQTLDNLYAFGQRLAETHAFMNDERRAWATMEFLRGYANCDGRDRPGGGSLPYVRGWGWGAGGAFSCAENAVCIWLHEWWPTVQYEIENHSTHTREEDTP